MYIVHTHIYVCVCLCACVLKLQKKYQKNSKFISTAIKLNHPAQVIKNFSIRITATSSEDF